VLRQTETPVVNILEGVQHVISTVLSKYLQYSTNQHIGGYACNEDHIWRLTWQHVSELTVSYQYLLRTPTMSQMGIKALADHLDYLESTRTT